MKGRRKGTPASHTALSPDDVAVGYVATETNTDPLLRSVVRAQYHDYECLVAMTDAQWSETGELVEAIGADVINVEETESDVEDLQERLVWAARQRSHAGIILAPIDCTLIDYERTGDALDDTDAFSVEAVLRDDSIAADSTGTMVAIPAYDEAS